MEENDKGIQKKKKRRKRSEWKKKSIRPRVPEDRPPWPLIGCWPIREPIRCQLGAAPSVRLYPLLHTYASIRNAIIPSKTR